MKNIHIILFFTLWVILGSCSTYYVSNKQVMEVQQGMSRQNVEKILGKPDYRRFDGGGEEWEYHRISSVLYGNSIKIIVFLLYRTWHYKIFCFKILMYSAHDSFPDAETEFCIGITFFVIIITAPYSTCVIWCISDKP